MRKSLPLLAFLLLSAAVCWGAGFPYINGNTVRQARSYPVMDTISIPSGNKFRGIYLIEPTSGTVRAGIDSLLELWRNGGATPKFRKIQHLLLWNNSVEEEQLRFTIFDVRGTSHFRWVNQPYQRLDLPFEADSIQIQADPSGNQLDMSYVVW